MIKKLSIAAAVFVVLVLVAVLLFRQVAGPSDAATLVPADTVFFASLTDLPRSVIRWQGTSLAKIGSEPEVKAFLEKPLSQLLSKPGSGETGNLLAGLKPGRLFLAVTGITTHSADALVGFQYWGSRKDFDVAVARMRRELPPGELSTENHDGDEIVSSQHGEFALFTGTHGTWGFVSTNRDLIKSALDRVRGKQTTPPLTENPQFQAVSKRMLAAPDFLFFLEPQKAIDVLLETGKSLGAESIPEQVNELRSTEAVGGSLKLDGELQRDEVFLLRKSAKSADMLTHKTVRFSTSETVVFINFLARFNGLPALLEKALAGSAPKEAVVELADLASSAFGPECGIVLNWGGGQMAPSGMLAVEVRDHAKAAETLQKLTTLFPETRISEVDGIKLTSIPSVSNPIISPTLTLTDQFLILGVDPASVSKAAHSEGTSLTTLPAFVPALTAYQSSNEVFAFIDTRSLFERAYNTLRPVILFSAQVMPGAASMIDTGKLPQTETVSRHLPPVILSQQRLEDGVLIESSGPVTVSQLAIAAAIGGVVGAPKGR